MVKIFADLNNDGKQDAVIGHETTLGGGGLDWYQFPASGKATDPWTEHVIDAKADVYEAAYPANFGHKDTNGKPVTDLIVTERGTIVWYENPLGTGGNPITGTWTKHIVGTLSQGATHELTLADVDGDGKFDIVSNDTIFFQNSPTSWTQISTSNYTRTQKGLTLFDSGSGKGAIDVAGTGESPYNITWWENPRDHGGNGAPTNGFRTTSARLTTRRPMATESRMRRWTSTVTAGRMSSAPKERRPTGCRARRVA